MIDSPGKENFFEFDKLDTQSSDAIFVILAEKDKDLLNYLNIDKYVDLENNK